MAISRERLEELINEGATIYGVPKYDKKIYKLNAKNYSIDDNELNYLFETQKQAEWYLKYHATRIEELNLPMWEEFITEDKYNYYGTSYFGFDNYRLIAKLPDEDDDCEFIGIDVDGNTELYHWDEATEENYIKACDLCIKLFKGE